MNIAKIAIFPIVALILTTSLISCDKKSVSYDMADELVRLDAFREEHYPKAQQLPNHAFVMVEHENPSGETLQKESWLRFDYWATDLDGTYLGSSMAERAKDYGHFSKAVYYVPRFRVFSSEGFATEMFAALQNRHIGDELVIGLTSEQAKTLGLWKNANYKSALLHIILREQMTLPTIREIKLIEEYLKKNTGFEQKNRIYRKVTVNGKGDVVGPQATIKVQYAVYSLTGFLFDTNVAEVAQAHEVYNSKDPNHYKYLSMKATDDKDMINGFSGLTVGLKVGTRLFAIIPSSDAYGSKGKGEVPPYESLLVEMLIVDTTK